MEKFCSKIANGRAVEEIRCPPDDAQRWPPLPRIGWESLLGQPGSERGKRCKHTQAQKMDGKYDFVLWETLPDWYAASNCAVV